MFRSLAGSSRVDCRLEAAVHRLSFERRALVAALLAVSSLGLAAVRVVVGLVSQVLWRESGERAVVRSPVGVRKESLRPSRGSCDKDVEAAAESVWRSAGAISVLEWVKTVPSLGVWDREDAPASAVTDR